MYTKGRNTSVLHLYIIATHIIEKRCLQGTRPIVNDINEIFIVVKALLIQPEHPLSDKMARLPGSVAISIRPTEGHSLDRSLLPSANFPEVRDLKTAKSTLGPLPAGLRRTESTS